MSGQPSASNMTRYRYGATSCFSAPYGVDSARGPCKDGAGATAFRQAREEATTALNVPTPRATALGDNGRGRTRVGTAQIVGKISIANKPGGLSENDVRLVTVFAAQVAVVIQNAHLYRRLQESAAQLEAKVHGRTAELEATYRELAASHARLRELDQLKSDFLGNVSHELRTPLAAVKGYVDNLLDGVAGPLTDKPRHYLGRVRDNADRLGRMVSDLLDLTRIEAGKIELLPQALPLADVVGDAVDGLRHVATARQVRVNVDVPPCPTVWADPDKVHQVVTNLLANAIKFSPPGAEVAVSVRADAEGLVRLAVEDAGPGIPLTERERVFDKFYQVGRVEGERLPGTGLGLTIARHLVELHGGRIWIEDAPGGGAAFVVLLPPLDRLA